MTRQQWLWLLLGGSALAWIIYNRKTVSTTAADLGASMQAALSGWATVNNGPTWVPVINQTESALGIPPNLLARMAYQESAFKTNVIDGTKPSDAGALGILQLMPQFFVTVQRPIPFSTQDTLDQIQQAGQQLIDLYNTFQDWALAIAAYNDGAGNIKKYLAGQRALPDQTTRYVADVLADVPIAPNTLNA